MPRWWSHPVSAAAITIVPIFGFSPHRPTTPDFPHPGFAYFCCFVLFFLSLFCNSLQLLSALHLTRLQIPMGLVAPTFILCRHFLSWKACPSLDTLSRPPAWPLRARAFTAAATAMSWSKLTQTDLSWLKLMQADAGPGPALLAFSAQSC